MMSIPKDGTYVVLHPAQISNFDLVCAFKANYPHTEIIVSQKLPTGNERTQPCTSRKT